MYNCTVVSLYYYSSILTWREELKTETSFLISFLKLPSSKWHFDFCMLITFLIVTGFVSTVMQCILIMIPGQHIVNFSSFSCPWYCAACLCKLNFFVKCWEQLAHVNCSAIKMFFCCQYLKYMYIQIITSRNYYKQNVESFEAEFL